MKNHPFSNEYKTSAQPVLPEYFRTETLGGLLPGEMSFPPTTALVSDEQSKRLYIKTQTPLDEHTQNPGYFGGRIGVKRVYRPDGADFLDGYIADLRHTKHREVSTVSLLAEPLETASVLAFILTDPDGNPHFIGDNRLEDDALLLMEHINALSAPTRGSRAVAVAEQQPQVVPGPENYLG